ncbi:MAG: hypothetical protein EOO16_08015 [Chitinophagaceae bacterium]|nr:MAG: hypothetical protein EOO16_08015 [Chitinophagaceae bacterium]
MKLYSKLLSVLALTTMLFTACDKKTTLDVAPSGQAPQLEATTTTIAPAPADSNNAVITFRWTDPRYSSGMSTKYVLEIDSATKNFSNPLRREYAGQNTAALIAKDLNSWMLARGYAFGVPVSLQARVVSSYANNNERLNSNVLPIRATPYRIPPRVALPGGDRLYITGGTFGWNNTDPMPAYQELTKIDNTTWGGIFTLNSSSSYLFLPQTALVNWSDKYGWAGPNNANNTSGDLLQRNGGDIASPAATGVYKVIVDFQQGRFTVTPVSTPLITELYLTGDGAGGWTNTPAAANKLTQVSNGIFRITTTFTSGFIKLLSSPGNWQPQFGGSSATGGTLGANYGSGSDPDAIPVTAGQHTVTVNTLNMTYTVQ